MKLVFILPLLTLAHCDNSGGELLSVVVIFRHGERTPVSPYPTDPYRNTSYWPEGFGQLTNGGKMRHYLLGQWFRSRYENFLPSRYFLDDIYVRSTDVDRTLMSAEANLAGLYPPRNAQIWDADIPWQPIPVHTVPELQDPVLAMKKNCPKYDHLLKQLFKSQYFSDINRKNHDLYAYLTRYSGTLISSLETVEYLYNTLLIEHSNNLTLPDWALKVFPDKLKPWAELSFATSCFTRDLARLKAGPFFGQLTEHFRNKTTGQLSRKFLMFSGHDTTIANILNTIGVFQYHCPPYASTIIFELRRNSRTDYINIFYKNSTELQNVTLPGCQFDCNLDDFVRILAEVTLTVPEWTQQCQLSLWRYLEFDYAALLILLSVMAGLVLVIGGLALGIKFAKRNDDVTTYTQLPNDELA